MQLRYTLREFGWISAQEKFAYERERFYLTLRAAKGTSAEGPESPECWFGAPLLQEQNPFLYPYLLQMHQRFSLRPEYPDN